MGESKMGDILKIIKENGLSIRQIPDQVVALYELRHFTEGDTTVEEIIRKNVTQKDFEYLSKHFTDKTLIRFQGGNIYRKFCRRVKVPKDAGKWMVKEVHNTSTSVRWDSRTDIPFDTLEEAVLSWYQNSKKEK